MEEHLHIDSTSKPDEKDYEEFVKTVKAEETALPIEEISTKYYYSISEVQLEVIKRKSESKFDLQLALDLVQSLSYDIDPKTGLRQDYSLVRNKLMYLGILLNIHGVVPPIYRGMRTIPTTGTSRMYSSENNFLLNDRQLIDFHWIYCKKMPVNSINGYKNLFNSFKPFDWDAVSKLASFGGRFSRKSLLVGASEFNELQLTTVRSETTRTRWRTINNNLEKNQVIIRNYLDDPSCKIPPKMRDHLVNIYEALLFARGHSSNAVKAFEFKTGFKIPLKTMQRYAQRIRNIGIEIPELTIKK